MLEPKMKNLIKGLSLIMPAALLLTSVAGCAAPTTGTAAATRTRTVQVQKGKLDVTVSVDGNLNMPEAYNLHFGAPGDVKEVLVKEGDRVKAGAILARLDDTAQRLSVKASNIGVQQTLSNLYQTVPRLPQFPTTFYDVNTVFTPATTITITGWHDDGSHNWVYGPYTVDIPASTTYTFIEKPRWDWKWNDPDAADYDPTQPANDWIQDPNVPYNTPLSVGYPGYYANSMAMMAYNWAAEEAALAQELLAADNLTGAADQLYIALCDLDCSLKILEDAALNPMSGLGNLEPFTPEDTPGYTAFQIEQQDAFGPAFIMEIRRSLSSIKETQDGITRLRSLIAEGKKQDALQLFSSVLDDITDTGKVVMNNINIISQRGDTDVYGRDISNYLYTAASEKMDTALAGINKDGLDSADLATNLAVAEHYIKLCNAILGSNDYVLQHGLSLKNENQYKVELENKLIDVANKRDDFLKTVIMTPVDGIVVSVGVKENDVLSSQDYSSAGTIQVVDTSQIKFVGTVDEIDILKIKTGQKASVSVDAIPDRTFPGTVSFISPFGTPNTSGVVKFNITVLLDPTDVDLKGGLSATADIAIQSVEDALLLPVTAVTTTPSGSFVNLATDNTTKTEKREVKLGAQTTQYVQILSGLKEGDRVTITEGASGLPTSTIMRPPGGGGGPR